MARQRWQGAAAQRHDVGQPQWPFLLDRATGEFLLGKPFVEVNWMNGFDEKGRPIRVPGMTPSAEGTKIYPGNAGGTSWYSPSYSLHTGLFYVSAWVDYFSTYVKEHQEYTEGLRYVGGYQRASIPRGETGTNVRKAEDGHGAIRAIDPATGEKKWEFTMQDVTDAGVLTTASDLLFSGG